MKYKRQGESISERCNFYFQFKFLFAALLVVVAARIKKMLTFLLGCLNCWNNLMVAAGHCCRGGVVWDLGQVLIRTQRVKRKG